MSSRSGSAGAAPAPDEIAPARPAVPHASQRLGPAVGVVIGPVLATPMVARCGVEAVLVVDVAEPAMSADGRLTSTAGAVFGTGEGRGPALVLGGVGAILAVAGIWLGTSRLRKDFRVRTTSGSADVIAAVPPRRVTTP